MEMYKSLLSERKGTAMTDTVTDMRKLLKDTKMDESARNILYNQKLYNYLKQRREIMNKPVRVTMTRPTGPRILPEELHGVNRGPSPPPALPPRTPSPAHTNYSGYSGIGNLFTPVSPTPSQASSTLIPSTVDDDGTLVDDDDFDVPARRRRRRRPQEVGARNYIKIRAKQTEIINRVAREKAEEIYNELVNWIDPTPLGINRRGQIINKIKRTPLFKSMANDAKHALEKILGSTTARTPVGFNTFQSSLMNNVEINRRIRRAQDEIKAAAKNVRERMEREIPPNELPIMIPRTPKRPIVPTPRRPAANRTPRRRQQLGRGHVIYNTARVKDGRFVFKPESWI